MMTAYSSNGVSVLTVPRVQMEWGRVVLVPLVVRWTLKMMNLLVGISAKICISNSNCIKTISKLSAGVLVPRVQM